MENEHSKAADGRRKFIAGIPALGAGLMMGMGGGMGIANAQAGEPVTAAQRRGKLTKIGLEEHFIIPEFLDYLAETRQNINPALFSKAVPLLSDFGSQRLDTMDSNGIDYVVLSLSGPGVQIEKNTALAERMARKVNDVLAQQVSKRPDRYGGFAHLALQDPKAAADELERCMTQLGFKGALINGATNGVYLDDRRYDVFWERVQALKAPIYLHPANPVDHPAMYQDHPEMWGPTWSWAAETCSHAMRLIFSGVFDRFPDVNLILGHMGETIPIQPWRLDSRYAVSNQRYALQHKPSEYIRKNIYITTSGVCDDAALRCSLENVGTDKVMFSIDYPFENTKIASDWIDTAKISEQDRVKVASQNAIDLLRLDIHKAA
jgi:2,3-dihydroxybenzoate decarboxylase